jgi:D-alanyl-D-alanine carboxypeptidase/D-alanyl-D-alanine-endopeptidase (penicillin-binding protein 4)
MAASRTGRQALGALVALVTVAACAPAIATTPAAAAPGPREARTAGRPATRAGSTDPATRSPLAHFADSLLDDPMFRSAHWGVLVVDPLSGDTLYSRNAGKLFMPASNQKLITGAIALDALGKDFRFETRVMGAPHPIDGILTGDLAIIGSGDPTFSDSLAGGDAMAPFRAIADSLWSRGIRDITGRLIRGADTFPDSTLGFGWAWDDLDHGYSAPVDELTFNEGYATIRFTGAPRPNGIVTIATAPARTIPRLGTVEVTTAMHCCQVRSRVEWSGDVRGTRPVVNLRGTVRPGDTLTINVALRHPAAAWLDALHEALADRGIRVRGGTEPDLIADTTGMTTLVTRTSPPLTEVLARFQKPSQNQIGELLFKTVARVRTGVGTADSARRVFERQLIAWGADSAGFAVRDGSGLSRHDYLSPETIVRVLETMRRHHDFGTYYHALPVGGVDGTIRTRMRGTAGEGNVRAKTGTLDKARSLSGYVTTADGRLLLFSMLTNNHVVPTREVERVQDAIVDWLARSGR